FIFQVASIIASCNAIVWQRVDFRPMSVRSANLTRRASVGLAKRKREHQQVFGVAAVNFAC
ncbi:hypothetical protein, partial [Rhodopirellula europaea]|uniref:hypothetical protein n=1 Tax=Rhodopirellula europaea TaxID=1263866 RepID=UPI001F16B02C